MDWSNTIFLAGFPWVWKFLTLETTKIPSTRPSRWLCQVLWFGVRLGVPQQKWSQRLAVVYKMNGICNEFWRQLSLLYKSHRFIWFQINDCHIYHILAIQATSNITSFASTISIQTNWFSMELFGLFLVQYLINWDNLSFSSWAWWIPEKTNLLLMVKPELCGLTGTDPAFTDSLDAETQIKSASVVGSFDIAGFQLPCDS